MKKILLLLITVIASLCGFKNINAASTQNLTLKNSGWWWAYAYNGTYKSWHFNLYDFNGRVAYCINPQTDEGTDYYTGDWSYSNLSNDLKERMLLIAYYGYEYPGHDTLKYRAATQGLLWEAAGTTPVHFSERRYEQGMYDIESEKAEILRLVDNHYIKPSFNGKNYNIDVGTSITLTDTNNVLNNYKVIASNGAETSINGNKLTIKATKVGPINIRFEKKQYKTETYLIYYNGSAQRMLSAGFVDPIYSEVNINAIGGRVEIYKLDKEFGNNSNKVRVEATLQGATYGIFDAKTSALISQITTDSNGHAISEPLPKFGDYFLQEQIPSKGYQLDKTKYYFSSTLENKDASLKVYEEIITREIELTKVYATEESKIMTPEVGVKFGFYDSYGKEVIVKSTDSNGKIKLTLPYGTYTVKQLSTTLGHEKVKDFTIEVKTTGEKFYYTISNAEISARLKIVKIDKDTKNIITKPGATFKIKNLLTGKYVKQKVTYPSVAIYEEFKTDENGWLVTPYPLSAGEYLIEEVKAPEGYIIENNGTKFTIDENTKLLNGDNLGNYIEIKIENQEALGTIELKKEGDILVGINSNREFIYNRNILSDVEFEVYANEDIYSANNALIYKKGTLVEKIITSDKGIAKTKKLHLGKYCIKEIKTLSGYKLDEKTYCYDLEYKDQYTEIIEVKDTIYNEYKSAELELLKVGEYFLNNENGKNIFELKPLEGVTFGLYASENIYAENGKLLVQKDELIKSFKTEKDGKITVSSKMPFSSYYFKEIKTHDNYILNEEKYNFQLDKNSDAKEVIKLKVNNGQAIKNDMKTGNLLITKIDSNGNKLSGVEFTIYAEDKEKIIYQGVTNEDGIIDLKLPYGKYFYQETKALESYQLDDKLYEFEINDENKDITVEMENHLKTGTIIITKIDSNGNKLSGVEFTIYAEDKEKIIYQGVTNKDGIIELELVYGKYFYQETKALEGYQLDDKLYEFEINDENKNITVEMENILIPVPDTEANTYIIYIPIGLAFLGLSIYLIFRGRKK